MNTQKAQIPADASHAMLSNRPASEATSTSASLSASPTVKPNLESQPWIAPRTVIQQNDRDCYEHLKDRLAQIPSRSRQKRQTLYIDLWTGQHWLGITLTYPEGYEILKPVSVDTALSIATIGRYKLLNQPLFEDQNSGKLPHGDKLANCQISDRHIAGG